MFQMSHYNNEVNITHLGKKPQNDLFSGTFSNVLVCSTCSATHICVDIQYSKWYGITKPFLTKGI